MMQPVEREETAVSAAVQWWVERLTRFIYTARDLAGTREDADAADDIELIGGLVERGRVTGEQVALFAAALEVEVESRRPREDPVVLEVHHLGGNQPIAAALLAAGLGDNYAVFEAFEDVTMAVHPDRLTLRSGLAQRGPYKVIWPEHLVVLDETWLAASARTEAWTDAGVGADRQAYSWDWRAVHGVLAMAAYALALRDGVPATAVDPKAVAASVAPDVLADLVRQVLPAAGHDLDRVQRADPVSQVWGWLHRTWPPTTDPTARWETETRRIAPDDARPAILVVTDLARHSIPTEHR